MNTKGNSQHTMLLKRTQNDRNFSSMYTDSSSDEELAPRNNKLLPNLVLPGSTREACSKSKSTTNEGRACKKITASVEMLDLEKWSKSLVEDYKDKCQKMLAKFKKDLRNVAASNFTGNSTKNRGRHMPNTIQAQVQKRPHSAEPQRGQHTTPSSTRNFIPPARRHIQGSVCASNYTKVNHGGKGLLKIAVYRPGDQAQAQRNPRSVMSKPQQGQHMISSSTRNSIPPAGRQIQGSVCASNTDINHRRESLMKNSVNQPVYQAQVQKSPHSGPQQGLHTNSSSTSNFIPPAGQQIQGSVYPMSNAEFNHGRESLTINAINRPGYFTNLLAQAVDPNSSLYKFGNLSAPHRNNTHTSGMVPEFPLSFHQRLENTYHIPNQTLTGKSSGGVDVLGWKMNGEPAMFSGGSTHAVSSTNEAWLRMYGPNNGNLQ